LLKLIIPSMHGDGGSQGPFSIGSSGFKGGESVGEREIGGNKWQGRTLFSFSFFSKDGGRGEEGTSINL